MYIWALCSQYTSMQFISPTKRWQCSVAHFETDGVTVRAVCFKSLCDEAHSTSWRNGVYWRRSARMHVLKQTAWHCVLCVSIVFLTRFRVLRGRGSSYLTHWWHCKSVDTVGYLIDFRCRRRFQNCVHVAPGVAWRSVEWPLLRHRAYHSLPSVSKRRVTMHRELRDEAMNSIPFWNTRHLILVTFGARDIRGGVSLHGVHACTCICIKTLSKYT